MRKSTSLAFLSSVFLFHSLSQKMLVLGGEVIELNTTQFYDGVMSGAFDAIVDTRTAVEWALGRIPNSTFVESLQKYGEWSEVSTPAVLSGCENCRIAVYCSGGVRARGAAEKLVAAGFNGPVYNGQGIEQWTAAGYDIVMSDSAVPPCNCSDCDQCRTSEIAIVGVAATDDNSTGAAETVGDSPDELGDATTPRTSSSAAHLCSSIGSFMLLAVLAPAFLASS